LIFAESILLDAIIISPHSLQTPIPFVQMKGMDVLCAQNSGVYKIVQMAQLTLWVVIIYLVSK
jgi:hypothetical protein